MIYQNDNIDFEMTEKQIFLIEYFFFKDCHNVKKKMAVSIQIFLFLSFSGCLKPFYIFSCSSFKY